MLREKIKIGEIVAIIATSLTLPLLFADFERAVWGNPAPAEIPAALSVGPSTRLIIPALNINAKVRPVGLAADGKMAGPGNFKDAGWYKYGARPGEIGSAVIAGHLDNGFGLSAVFKNLSKLKEGDDIYIKTEDGAELHFIVSEVKTYPYLEVPGDLIFEQNDARRLNLITCEGAWIPRERTYDQRVIVFSKLAE